MASDNEDGWTTVGKPGNASGDNSGGQKRGKKKKLAQRNRANAAKKEEIRREKTKLAIGLKKKTKKF